MSDRFRSYSSPCPTIPIRHPKKSIALCQTDFNLLVHHITSLSHLAAIFHEFFHPASPLNFQYPWMLLLCQTISIFSFPCCSHSRRLVHLSATFDRVRYPAPPSYPEHHPRMFLLCQTDSQPHAPASQEITALSTRIQSFDSPCSSMPEVCCYVRCVNSDFSSSHRSISAFPLLIIWLLLSAITAIFQSFQSPIMSSIPRHYCCAIQISSC